MKLAGITPFLCFDGNAGEAVHDTVGAFPVPGSYSSDAAGSRQRAARVLEAMNLMIKFDIAALEKAYNEA